MKLPYLGVILLLISISLTPQKSTCQVLDEKLLNILSEAKRLNGKESVPLLAQVDSICRSQACTDGTIAQYYHVKSIVFFNGYIDDELALAYTDTAANMFALLYGKESLEYLNSIFNKSVFQQLLGRHGSAKHNIEISSVRLKN